MLSYLGKKYPFKKVSAPSYFSICAFCLLSLLSNVTNAQDKVEQKSSKKQAEALLRRFELAVNGGLSLNKFSNGQPHMGFNTGYTAGISLNYKLFKGLYIQLEANSIQQGGRMLLFKDDTRLGLPESIQTKNVTNSSYQINSLEAPLLLGYTFNIKPTWKPSIYAGGSYAYTLNVHETYQKTGDLLPGEDIIATISGSDNATSEFRKSRYSFIAGANTKLPLTSRLFLLVDMRYINGLTAARKNYSYMDKVGFGTDLRTNSFISKLGIVLSL